MTEAGQYRVLTDLLCEGRWNLSWRLHSNFFQYLFIFISFSVRKYSTIQQNKAKQNQNRNKTEKKPIYCNYKICLGLLNLIRNGLIQTFLAFHDIQHFSKPCTYEKWSLKVRVYLGMYCFVQIQPSSVPNAEYSNTIQGTKGGNLFLWLSIHVHAQGVIKIFWKWYVSRGSLEGGDVKIVVVAGVLYNLPASGSQEGYMQCVQRWWKRADGVLFHRGDSGWVRNMLFLLHSLTQAFPNGYLCVCMCVCVKLQMWDSTAHLGYFYEITQCSSFNRIERNKCEISNIFLHFTGRNKESRKKVMICSINCLAIVSFLQFCEPKLLWRFMMSADNCRC